MDNIKGKWYEKYWKKYFQEGIIIGVWDFVTELLARISILKWIVDYIIRRITIYGIVDKSIEIDEKDLKKHKEVRRLKNKLEQKSKDQKELQAIIERKKRGLEKWKYWITETWVLIHTILAIISSIGAYYISGEKVEWILWLITAYATFRIFEVVVYHVRVLLFDGMKQGNGLIKNTRRSILCVIHNFVEIIYWYASIIIMQTRWSEGLGVTRSIGDWGEYIKCSVLIMVTSGDSYTPVMEVIQQSMARNSLFLDIIFAEVICGFILTIVSFARFISILPGPNVIDE